jgi:DNA-binding IclR family transcriptional regulator
MTRASPQTDRIRWTMNLLASNPRESFNLAQIARHLGVSKATCLPMISALTSAGWLVRHPVHKTYRLGPALVTLGRAAERTASLDDVAVPKMVDLAAEAGLPCISWVPSGDRMVLAEVVNANGPLAAWNGLKRGHRLTPAPPMGAALVAWTDTTEIDAWIKRARPDDLDASRTHYAPGLHAARERGYVVELRHPLHHQIFLLTQRIAAEHPESMDELLRLVASAANRELGELDVLAADLEPDEPYLPVSINAPVFGATDEIEMLLCLTDAPAPMPGRDVHRLGRLVRDLCIELSAHIGGVSRLVPN